MSSMFVHAIALLTVVSMARMSNLSKMSLEVTTSKRDKLPTTSSSFESDKLLSVSQKAHILMCLITAT